MCDVGDKTVFSYGQVKYLSNDFAIDIGGGDDIHKYTIEAVDLKNYDFLQKDSVPWLLISYLGLVVVVAAGAATAAAATVAFSISFELCYVGLF